MIGEEYLSRSTYLKRNVELVPQAIVPLEQERLCSATTTGKSGSARNAIHNEWPRHKSLIKPWIRVVYAGMDYFSLTYSASCVTAKTRFSRRKANQWNTM